LLTRLGLGERIHYKPKKLSGGQKQRVAIARGLVHQPRLILADEPTAALDKTSGREAVTMLQELAKEHGSTIVMVTHDNRILDVADRIVRMVDGNIVYNVFVQEAEIICEFLHNIPMFADFTTTTLTMIAESMTPTRFSANATIIRQGDEGDLFYVIRDGDVEVSVASGGGEKVVKQLGQGDYFGEVALMTNEKRNATVRAKGVTTCYTLSKDKFRETLDKSQTFQEELRNALAHRR
jgi:putative ABC transport system ATP-binding protein